MFVKPSSAFVGKPSVVASSSGSAKYARYARLFPSTRKSSESRAGASSRSSSTPVRVFGLIDATLSSGANGARAAALRDTARAGHGARRRGHPQPAAAGEGDRRRRRRGARRAALPARGDGLDLHARSGTRATIVIESPALPIPGSPNDPRQQAISAVVDELERQGIPTGYQTFLVASGLARRSSQRELETFVTPELARRFHGHVIVHDVEDPELVLLDDSSRPPLRVNRALVETDLVIVVSAAESVLHGGPSALLAAAGADALRAAGAYSLLETAASRGWHLAVALERALSGGCPARRVARAQPSGDVGRAARLSVRPGRGGADRELAASLRVRSAAGDVSPRCAALVANRDHGRCCVRRPSVDRARGGVAAGGAAAQRAARRAARRARDRDPERDAVPAARASEPAARRVSRARARACASGATRSRSPTAARRSCSTGSRATSRTRRSSRTARSFTRRERGAIRACWPTPSAARREDARAIEAYRSGRTVHPLLPFHDWNSCQPALGRLGAVLVAGAGDASAVRQLGFVPVHGVHAALEMARGQGHERIGFLLSPPYFPIRVGG